MGASTTSNPSCDSKTDNYNQSGAHTTNNTDFVVSNTKLQLAVCGDVTPMDPTP